MKAVSKVITPGKLFKIEVPQGKRLIFNGIEYSENDIFLILSKPEAYQFDLDVDKTKRKWYRVQALVKEQIIDIEFIDYQLIHFKEIVET